MGTKSCAKILNFSTTFSCENLAVEDFVTLFMGKKNADGEMLFLGMVLTNLYMLFYAGDKRMRFARADKAVALQYNYQ